MIRWPASCSPIGLDLGARSIKAVQLGGRAAAPTVIAELAVRRPERSEDPAWYHRLDHLLAMRGFRGRSFVIAAPVQHLRGSVLDLPTAADPKAAEQAARMALARLHRIEPNSFEYAIERVTDPATGKPRKQVMSYVLEHTPAEELIRGMEAEGFDAQRIEVPAAALATAMFGELGSSPGLALCLDLGWRACRVIACLDGVVVYERSIEAAGLEPIFASVAEATGQPFETVHELLRHVDQQTEPSTQDPTVTKALRQYAGLAAEEFRICLNYVGRLAQANASPAILIAGGGSRYRTVRQQLGAALSTEPKASEVGGQTCLALAFGLALRGWGVAA